MDSVSAMCCRGGQQPETPDETLGASSRSVELSVWKGREFEDEDESFTTCSLSCAISVAFLIAMPVVGIVWWFSAHDSLTKRNIVLIEVVLLYLAIVAFCFNHILGRCLIEAVQRLDRKVLGIDVQMDSMTPYLCRGIIHIRNLEAMNPDGFNSPYLLHAGEVHLDVKMWKLFCSLFKSVEIEHLVLRDVDVIYESAWGTSNVAEVLAKLGKKKSKTSPETQNSDVEEDPLLLEEKKDKKRAKKADTQVKLVSVTVENVGARVETRTLGGLGTRIAVHDIRYDDFSTETEGRLGDEVLQMLLRSILKSVMINVFGQSVGGRVADLQ
mmetsp:Transcript_78547/g.138403  ORF Transcript_78547/g.138403 Transcript_78547/m.138403 type:complete len:326 (+) Transcript_78547:61-1038(+)|eukprot:CAMPEP_0197632314 /NCGR_PEP_ID=MMETSP1338-20131121/9126_1 /TAXON_ID=43686 ORGANISM="Pelagodinium beii, Strain RCC1491" /NCGR_SAMPLE_ID=MMETSP1338 /ASSEMBLY_ACC=CAM_ASM_000754 /LENGTH=325 /DNA_ID=CAMNT_0043203875 /DNA_START=58 /DNA_END=1035 /DNA_ORIENTATION=+